MPCHAFLLWLVVGVAFLCAVGHSQTPTSTGGNWSTGTVCTFATSSSHTLTSYLSFIYHRRWAAQEGVRLRSITGTNTLTLLQRVFSSDFDDCDIFTGPGFSTLSTQLNPALPRLQIEHAAASEDLTAKSTFPFFSRTNPGATVQGAGVVDFIRAQGWEQFSVIASTDAYSASVAAAVARRAQAANVTIAETFLLSNSDPALIEDIIASAVSSNMRVFAVIFTYGIPTAAEILRTLNSTGFNRRHVMVGAASFCGNVVNAARRETLAGTICVTGAYNETMLSDLEARGRDEHSSDAQYARAVLADGGSTLNHNVNLSSTYTSYSVDAIGLAIRTLLLARQRNVSTSDLPDMYAVLGDASFSGGLTGMTRVDTATGSRFAPQLAMLNFRRSPTTGAVEFVHVGTHSFSSGVYVANGVEPRWFDGESTYPTSASIVEPQAPAEDSANTLVVVLAVVLSVMLVVLVALVCLVVRFKLRPNPNAYAPKDATKTFAVGFVAVKGLTALRYLDADAADKLTSGLRERLRHAIVRHNVYEGPKAGDAHMLCATSAAEVLLVADELHAYLEAEEWTRFVDDIVKGASSPAGQQRPAVETDVASATLPALSNSSPELGGAPPRDQNSEGHGNSDSMMLSPSDQQGGGGGAGSSEVGSLTLRSVEMRGQFEAMERARNAVPEGFKICIAVGVHTGFGKIVGSEETSYEYSGAVVTIAALVTDVALGGQTLASVAARDHLMDEGRNDLVDRLVLAKPRVRTETAVIDTYRLASRAESDDSSNPLQLPVSTTNDPEPSPIVAEIRILGDLDQSFDPSHDSIGGGSSGGGDGGTSSQLQAVQDDAIDSVVAAAALRDGTLVRRRVTVVVATLEGLSDAPQHESRVTTEISRHVSAIGAEVDRLLIEFGGVLMSFGGNRLYASFNAHAPALEQVRRAAGFAFSLHGTFQQRLGVTRVTTGIGTSHAYVGYSAMSMTSVAQPLPTNPLEPKIKFPVVVGKCVHDAEVAEDAIRRLPRAAHEPPDAPNAFLHCGVTADHPELWGPITGTTVAVDDRTGTVIAAVLSYHERSQDADEWRSAMQPLVEHIAPLTSAAVEKAARRESRASVNALLVDAWAASDSVETLDQVAGLRTALKALASCEALMTPPASPTPSQQYTNTTLAPPSVQLTAEEIAERKRSVQSDQSERLLPPAAVRTGTSDNSDRLSPYGGAADKDDGDASSRSDDDDAAAAASPSEPAPSNPVASPGRVVGDGGNAATEGAPAGQQRPAGRAGGGAPDDHPRADDKTIKDGEKTEFVTPKNTPNTFRFVADRLGLDTSDEIPGAWAGHGI